MLQVTELLYWVQQQRAQYLRDSLPIEQWAAPSRGMARSLALLLSNQTGARPGGRWPPRCLISGRQPLESNILPFRSTASFSTQAPQRQGGGYWSALNTWARPSFINLLCKPACYLSVCSLIEWISAIEKRLAGDCDTFCGNFTSRFSHKHTKLKLNICQECNNTNVSALELWAIWLLSLFYIFSVLLSNTLVITNT